MADYVTYYRVSTQRQGKSGLGISAQRTSVEAFLTSDDRVVGEFVEIGSGKHDDRAELWRAIGFAKANRAKLLIAKLDRFSRRVSFIARLMDEGISLVVAEMPNANDFQLHIFAALAQEERRLISERTCRALAEAKRKGVELGKNGKVLAARRKVEAWLFAASLSDVIGPILSETSSPSEVARRLNDLGVRSYRGAQFYPQTAKALMTRLAQP
jgi:DNA invertase Pin-like site-specific DNA recombinase